MFRKVISAFLSLTMLTGLATPVFAMGQEKTSSIEVIHEEKVKSITGEYADNIASKTLNDLDGNEFELIETGNFGYYIFDRVSGKYLEETSASPSPYLGLDDNLYYFGPMNYYQKVGDIFNHTVCSDYSFTAEVAADFQSSFSEGLDRSRATKNEEVLSLINQRNFDPEAIQTHFAEARVTNTFVPIYGYIQHAVYPENVSGTCGYTASCIILSYWNKRSGNVVKSQFLDGYGNLITNGYTLQDKLLSYGNVC